jgi:hypothetical protein
MWLQPVRRISFPEWKGDGVVLGKISYPEHLLTRVLKSWIQGINPALME